ncbi:MAG: acyl-CoA thioesterase [Rubrimonas sp.]
MYPFLRTALVMRRARRRPALPVDGLSELRLTCWPIDVDVYAEMNNGRVLTLYDLGRLDHAVRTGLTGEARRRRWGFAVGGASVRYRRRVRPFDRVTLLTRPLGRDDRWFYMHQAMRVRGEAVSAALLRLAVTTRSGIVPTDAVVASMGAPDWRPALPDWAEAWIEAEDRRPWPPDLT